MARPSGPGVAYESPEDMVADEIGKTHPRWVGSPVSVGGSAVCLPEGEGGR
jgi:hypothetical protein